jgi:hypothetical protein
MMVGSPKFSGSLVVPRPIDDGSKPASSGPNVSSKRFQPPRSSKRRRG